MSELWKRSIPKTPYITYAIIMASLLIGCGAALAQDSQDTGPGPQDAAPAPPPAQAPSEQQNPNRSGVWRRFSKQPQNQAPEPSTPSQSTEPSNSGVPEQLTIKPRTYVTVRVDQFLSSDRNRAGDVFSGTLERPIVVDGIVVAERGQTVGGRVVEAQKAGRVKGVSRLALRLTDLTVADGQLVRIGSQLASFSGPKSPGRDATALGTSTAVGASIGAAASGGAGAAIGAGAGALAGTVGVLLTRGRPTVIYPESTLTFRIEDPVIVSTSRAPEAFRYVSSADYERPQRAHRGTPPPPPCAAYGCPPPPYYYGYYGPWDPYWGPSVAFFYGPRFFGHRFRRW